MNYKLAIFDLDGTILNTLDDLKDAMNHTLRSYGFKEHNDDDEVKTFIGYGSDYLMNIALPEGSKQENFEEIIEAFDIYYKEHSAVKTRPYEGIPEMLRELRDEGIITAVVSNKLDWAVPGLLDKYFPGLFDFCVGEKEGVRTKPWPDSVNAVLEKFKIDRKDAIFIGDTEVDFRTAQNADMDVIMVGWGFRSEEYLKSIGVESIIYDPQKITEIILECGAAL